MTKQAAQPTKERPAVTSPDGLPADIVVRGSLDPYIDPCPAWCEYAADGHEVACNDSDRSHFGHRHVVPVRSIHFEYTGEPISRPPVYTVGTLDMYLQRNTRHREPAIWLGKGDSNEGVTLTIDEAESIARTLLEIVAVAR